MNDVEINKILADEEIAFTRHMTPNEYVKLIFNKQVYPVIYERICILEIKIHHMNQTKSILERMIKEIKSDGYSSGTVLKYTDELDSLAENQILDYNLLNEKYCTRLPEEQEAHLLMIYLGAQVTTSNKPVSDLMQFNDKIKIDKKITRAIIDNELIIWREKRKEQVISSECNKDGEANETAENLIVNASDDDLF